MLFGNKKPAAVPPPSDGWSDQRLRAISKPLRGNTRDFQITAAAFRQALTVDECTRKLYGNLDLVGAPEFPVPASITFEVLDRSEHAERLEGWVPVRTPAQENVFPRPGDFCGYVTLEEVDNHIKQCASAVFQCHIFLDPSDWSSVRETLSWASTTALPVDVSVRVEFPSDPAHNEDWPVVPQWGITRYWIEALVLFDRAAASTHPEFRSDADVY